jgi:hypothetical protein
MVGETSPQFPVISATRSQRAPTSAEALYKHARIWKGRLLESVVAFQGNLLRLAREYPEIIEAADTTPAWATTPDSQTISRQFPSARWAAKVARKAVSQHLRLDENETTSICHAWAWKALCEPDSWINPTANEPEPRFAAEIPESRHDLWKSFPEKACPAFRGSLNGTLERCDREAKISEPRRSIVTELQETSQIEFERKSEEIQTCFHAAVDEIQFSTALDAKREIRMLEKAWEASGEIAEKPLAALSHEHSQSGSTPTAPIPTETRDGKRQSVVRPLLEKNGWSILDWAAESNVDFHTADNYLKGKTNPYRSTRKKMADALGMPVTDLPK